MPGKSRKRPWSLYCTVIAHYPSPLIIVRLPECGMRWRIVVSKIGDILREHGAPKNHLIDVEALAGYADAELRGPWAPTQDQIDSDTALASKLDAAFSGVGTAFPRFWLYSWDDPEQKFLLARRPLE